MDETQGRAAAPKPPPTEQPPPSTGLEQLTLSQMVETALIGPGLDADRVISTVRARIDEHFKGFGRYPGFMDVGINVYQDVYDWHVRYRQPIHILQIARQRSAIQFMFTQLVLRWEVPDPNHLGIPYD